MPKPPRFTRLALTIAIAVGTLAVGAVLYNAFTLPHPDRASSTELLMWLVRRDLTEEPIEIRHALLNRLVDSLDDALTAAPEDLRLSVSQKEQLARNVELLKSDWLQLAVDEYHLSSEAERWLLLQRQVATIDEWVELSGRYSAKLGWQEATAGTFILEIEQWVDASPRDQQPRIKIAVKNAAMCWLATRDLAAQDMDARRSLAARIASELDQGLELSNAMNRLAANEQEMLLHNSELLMEAWVYNLLDAFDELSPEDYLVSVSEQIERVRQWGVLELLGGGQNGPIGQVAGALRLHNLFDTWIERADDGRQDRMRDLHETILAQLGGIPR